MLSEKAAIQSQKPPADGSHPYHLKHFTQEVYPALFTGDPPPPPRIQVFSTEQDYLNNTEAVEGYYAHYSPQEKTIYTYRGAGPGPLYHELVHHWIRFNIRGNLPLWFEEGLASLYESPHMDANPCTLRFYHTNWRHHQLRGQWTDLDRFMQRVDLPDDHDKAQARYIFLWLAKNDHLKCFLRQYRQAVDIDPSGRQALVECAGRPLEEIDRLMQAEKEEGFSSGKARKTKSTKTTSLLIVQTALIHL